jgi:hypothetical protein
MPSTFQRHFTFKHPLFRMQKSASGEPWENSVYYLWWEFLRRHEGYKKTCDNDGKGKYANLYADFGNVHDVSFKDWWTKGDLGAKLFAEPFLPISVVALTPEQVNEISEAWSAGAVLVVAIPLTLRKRFISQKLNKLLKQRHKRRRGERTFRESRARYPIATQFNRHSLKTALEAYDLHASKPELKLWQIAQELRLGDILTKDELTENARVPKNKDKMKPISDKKQVLSVAASKKLATAHKIIDGVGRGIFPQLG